MKTLIKKSFVVLAFQFIFGCSKLDSKPTEANSQEQPQAAEATKEQPKKTKEEKQDSVIQDLLTPKMVLDAVCKKIDVDETIRLGKTTRDFEAQPLDIRHKILDCRILLGTEQFHMLSDDDRDFILGFKRYFHLGDLIRFSYWIGDRSNYSRAVSALKLQDVRSVVMFKIQFGGNDQKKRDKIANAILRASEAGLSEIDDDDKTTLIGYSEFLVNLPRKPTQQMVEAKRKREQQEEVSRQSEREALKAKQIQDQLALEKQLAEKERIRAEKEKQRAEKERLDREREEKAKAEEAKQVREERSRFAMLVGTRGTFEKEAQEKTKDIRELTDRIVAKERIFFQKWEDYLKSIKMTKEEADALIKRGRREKWPE